MMKVERDQVFISHKVVASKPLVISLSGKRARTLGALCIVLVTHSHSLHSPHSPLTTPDLLDPGAGWMVNDTLLLEANVWNVRDA